MNRRREQPDRAETTTLRRFPTTHHEPDHGDGVVAGARRSRARVHGPIQEHDSARRSAIAPASPSTRGRSTAAHLCARLCKICTAMANIAADRAQRVPTRAAKTRVACKLLALRAEMKDFSEARAPKTCRESTPLIESLSPRRRAYASLAMSTLTAQDIHLFREGTHCALYRSLGAHLTSHGDAAGARFAVWAPNASAVSVIGDFNEWRRGAAPRFSLARTAAASGKASWPASSTAPPTSTTSHRGCGRLPDREGRSRSRFSPRSRREPPRAPGRSITTGTTTSGCARAPDAMRSMRRGPSTRCTLARGAGRLTRIAR